MNGKSFHVVLALLLIGGLLSNSVAFAELSYDDLVESATDDLINFSENEHLTKPTFGISQKTNQLMVDDGFVFNNQTFSITNNFHTPFQEQSIKLGEINSFETKVFAPKGLKVQEFLFGIPTLGQAHVSELQIEVWYNFDGEIENVLTIQQSNVIDENSILVSHEKAKCKSFDTEKKCDTTKISMMFLEPLKDKVMAIKAIDHKNRYQITYLNHGFDISDPSLNPMPTVLISPQNKGEKPLKVTQIEKYSTYWIASDGRMFERNNFGSFKEINISFERFQDSGDPLTRLHSGFGAILDYERQRALNIFNATSLTSEIPESYSIEISLGERITDEIEAKMIEQQKIAQKILEESNVQERFSNINS
jgi:hypothetical protein